MTGPIEPYLKYGVICERVLTEKDDVLSLIRIVDKFTITITGKEPPPELPEGVRVFTIVMCWAGGLGTHEAIFNIQSPSGETQPSPQSWSFNLDALNRSHSIIVRLPVRIPTQGVYWLQFILNGEIRSRIPFQVVYERQKLRG